MNTEPTTMKIIGLDGVSGCMEDVAGHDPEENEGDSPAKVDQVVGCEINDLGWRPEHSSQLPGKENAGYYEDDPEDSSQGKNLTGYVVGRFNVSFAESPGCQCVGADTRAESYGKNHAVEWKCYGYGGNCFIADPTQPERIGQDVERHGHHSTTMLGVLRRRSSLLSGSVPRRAVVS